MGDRYDRNHKKGLHPALRGLKPPSEIIAWGLTARIGHNQGPPLEEPVADAYVRWRWRKAYQEAWKTPSMSILKLRMARAEAAGVTYREYMLELLHTGRHLQAEDVAKRRAAAKPQPLGGNSPAGATARPRGKSKPEPL